MWSEIRARVLKGEVVYGMMVRHGRDPGVTTLVGKAGFDFVFIDMEHGPYSLETVSDLIRGARSVGCAPIIRVAAADFFSASRMDCLLTLNSSANTCSGGSCSPGLSFPVLMREMSWSYTSSETFFFLTGPKGFLYGVDFVNKGFL